MPVQFLSWEDVLEEEMVTHSSILAWEIPWTEEPNGLKSMRLQKVRHNLANKQEQQLLVKESSVFPPGVNTTQENQLTLLWF